MIIYEMQATFGKLQNETLTLTPGLNILEAPNEWGKSTWCAFLTAMLYGVDTRAKTTKVTLADKERFAPWSGVPMAGRIDLCWQGRDITIERSTRRRVPMGEFRAYETASGLPVPELTADNCGQLLLGVEQSVFRRAGFIRFSDLPLTQDDNLRTRLNALVTTGDDSGDGEKLARELRDLKNTIQYNRRGLLPEAEAAQAALRQKLEDIRALEEQCARLELRLEELATQRRELENHRNRLRYDDYLENTRRLQEAQREAEAAKAACRSLEAQTGGLPSPEQTRERMARLRLLAEELSHIRQERELLPLLSREPAVPRPFDHPQPERMLLEDTDTHRSLSGRKDIPLYVLFALAAAAAAVCLVLRLWLPGAVAAVVGMGLLAAALVRRSTARKQLRILTDKYGSPDPAAWRSALEDLRQKQRRYQAELADYGARQARLREAAAQAQQHRQALCPDSTPEAALELCRRDLEKWDAYRQARREAELRQAHCEALTAAVRPVPEPQEADGLTLTPDQTREQLEENGRISQALRDRLWQYQGQKDAQGHREELEQELQRLQRRIAGLQKTLSALLIAQDTLTAARQELQRRFAPRIARRAQALLAELTDGRYRRLSLKEDFSLEAEALEEDTLRAALWRSDGTVDQLYLALRLAVADELTPGTPLILDDALVRFDDTRLKAALKVLQRQAETRQVLLFTCHSRERQLLEM